MLKKSKRRWRNQIKESGSRVLSSVEKDYLERGNPEWHQINRRFDTMQERGFTEKDWKIFRSKIAEWQEAYMDRLNKEYIELLSEDADPSDKFWGLEERIKKDKNKTGVRVEMSRSNLIYNIISLINEGAICFEDLKEFSDQLRETVKFIVER